MTSWILLVDSSHVILCSLASQFGSPKQPEKRGMHIGNKKLYLVGYTTTAVGSMGQLSGRSFI